MVMIIVPLKTEDTRGYVRGEGLSALPEHELSQLVLTIHWRKVLMRFV
jgi:hypothetical protein